MTNKPQIADEKVSNRLFGRQLVTPLAKADLDQVAGGGTYIPTNGPQVDVQSN